jgi:hypothetical protein
VAAATDSPAKVAVNAMRAMLTIALARRRLASMVVDTDIILLLYRGYSLTLSASAC